MADHLRCLILFPGQDTVVFSSYFKHHILMKLIGSQIFMLARASIKARYRNTWAGLLWVILNPIIMYSVQAFVFQHFLKINYKDYPLFLMGGLLPWIFISSSIEVCLPQFQNSAEMLKSFSLHPVVLVLSKVLDNALNFLLAFVLILSYQLATTDNLSFVGLLFIPLAMLQLLVGVCGVVWLLATLQVFYRDIRFVVQFLLNVAFFVTPILYPPSFIPETYRWLLSFNPVYWMISALRSCVHNFSLVQFLGNFTSGVVLSAIFILLAWYYWKRVKNEFYLKL